MDHPINNGSIVSSTGNLIIRIAKAIVEKPDEVVLEIVMADAEVSMRLRVAPEDRMKVIGHRANVLFAIRAILAVINSKTTYHFDLIVEESC